MRIEQKLLVFLLIKQEFLATRLFLVVDHCKQQQAQCSCTSSAWLLRLAGVASSMHAHVLIYGQSKISIEIQLMI